MKRLFAVRSFLISFCFAGFLGLLGFYGFDIWYGSQLAVGPDHDYTNEIDGLRQQGKIGEALAICHYVQSQPGMPNREAIITVGTEIERVQGSWFGKSKRFATGFLMGSSGSVEEMAGTVLSDFLIIGDIRDLGNEGYKASSGQDVDKMVVALSTLGVVTSAISWIPEPGEPAVASIDGGVAVLKSLRKANALTLRFAQETTQLAKEAAGAKKIGRFGELLENLKILLIGVPAGTIGTAMKSVESLDDLKAIARVAKTAPNEMITLLSLGGKGGSEWLKTSNKIPIRMLGKVLRAGTSRLSELRPYRYLRGVKFIYRGRLKEIRNTFIDWLMDKQSLRPALFVLSACALGGATLSGISALIHFRRITDSSSQ